VVLDQHPQQLAIALTVRDDGAIAYEISTGNLEDKVVHSQGLARLAVLPAPATVALAQLQERIKCGSFTASQCYSLFTAMGISYGSAHQGLAAVYTDGQQVLAKLVLPACVHDSQADYLLHPSLMDAALQASIGFVLDRDGGLPTQPTMRSQPALPFALAGLEVYAPCPADLWVWVRFAEGSVPNDTVQRLDIDIFDDNGGLCVRMSGFALRSADHLPKAPDFGGMAPLPEPSHQTMAQGIDLTVVYLKTPLAELIKLPAQRIAAHIALANYGVDSVMMMAYIRELEKTFGALPKTLLFEYPNLQVLADYFWANHQQTLLPLLALKAPFPAPDVASVAKAKAATSATLAARSPAPLNNPAVPNVDIAIIGLAGRYPGAATLEEFWANLQTGKDCITEIPLERWDWREQFNADKNVPGKSYSKWGGFIEGVDEFDPLFFNISPRVADMLDPMVRLFLQTVWHVLESAGHTPMQVQQRYQARVGVYVGAMYQHYPYHADTVHRPVVSLSSYSAIANRVSQFFDFQGPSVAIDTMCSSALVAIHNACESLRNQECRLAIAGAVNLSIHPDKYLGLSQAQLLGSHAQSRSFADGDGYIPAEGVGVVLLKPLADAIADGDEIFAVIKSTTTNHAGQSQGYSTPNPHAQTRLIADNFRKSGIHPRTISYVEAAAAGSVLADSIELTALTKAFKEFTEDRQFCALGSVKAAIGHAEAASGMSQLTKVLMQLRHQQLAPTLIPHRLNPELDFEHSPFYLQRELQHWPQPLLTIDGVERVYPRRATISAFGAGGSNAHLIIEEYQPPVTAPVSAIGPHVIVLSAKNGSRLQAVAAQLYTFVSVHDECLLADLAHTLQSGRVAMSCRLALVVDDLEMLRHGLQAYLHGQNPPTPLYTGDCQADDGAAQYLLSGETGAAMLQLLLAAHDLPKLALYWAKGADIPWQDLHKSGKPRMIALPGYPFAPEKCWLGGGARPTVPDTFTPSSAAMVVDDMSQFLANALAQVLKLDKSQIKPHSAFYELGADSIALLELIRDVEERLGLPITRSDLVYYPTLEALAGYLVSLARPPLQSALSEGQQGLWLLQKYQPDMGAYNVPMAFRIKQLFVLAAFKQALVWVRQQYPILGTVIREQDGIPYQTVTDFAPLAFNETS
ncbi:MAG: beta-ketoacyl synthase N-terminal-like domain-containing protein, partial [Methylovulum sp.]|nr:beta-ketoacyl synthase N-terminal-like domain-containing protein [Methylovulum sp.]